MGPKAALRAEKGKRVKEKRLIVLAKAEANAAAKGGPAVVAIGAAQVPGVVDPTAAAQHAAGAAFWTAGVLVRG